MKFRGLFLTLAVSTTALAQAHLIPMPRTLAAKGDVPLTAGVTVLCEACDAEDAFAADGLRQELAARHIPSGTGLLIKFQRLAQHPDPSFTDSMKPEGYTIISTPGSLTLTGATASGVFYAAQTAKQMIEPSVGGFILHDANIRDWPAMKYRGLSDDLSRGPMDTLEFQKKIIRTLAAYKCNLYSPYFEHAQQYAQNPLPAPPGGAMSADDARQLVAYAAHFHVMVVPEQEAFGHLHHDLIWEQYSQLAETPHGEVLAPGQPGSITTIQQMFGELAQLYPAPFLHIGADETEDLGRGQTKTAVDTQSLGLVYLDFMQKIVTALQPLGRRLLFWGDIAQKSPDLLKAMPTDFKRETIAIAWEYNPNPKGFAKYLHPYTDAGFETWVAPGVNNWSRMYPNYNYALANIQQFTRDGQAIGSTGQLNTLWYDDGEALASNNWYGILFGAAAAWQQGESSIPQFQQSYAQVFHGDTTGKLNQAQIEIMAAHALLKTQAKTGDGSDGLFWLDPFSKDGQTYAVKLRPYLVDVRLHAEKALQLIAEARAAAPAPSTNLSSRPDTERAKQVEGAVERSASAIYDPANAFPSNPTTLREPDAIDALELGARRFDFMALKFQLADEIAQGYSRAQTDALSRDKKTHELASTELSQINGVNGRIQDIKDGYSLLRDLYAQSWLRTNRPYALRPVLEHYDYTIGLWLARMDKIKSAQRQFNDNDTLPPASDLGIPFPAVPTARAN